MTAHPAPSSHPADAAELLRAHGEALAGYFREILARYAGAPARLMESIEYSLMAGGKRLRPALILECCRACGGRDGSPSHEAALAASAAMELIHTFSLIHDDLPAMDDDDLRRGRPTNHKVFGEAMAILAGDAMVTMAFELLGRDVPAPLAARMVQELASGAGPEGMIGGQVLDIDGENKHLSLQDLQQLHRMKTGALLTASCRLGAMAGGANEARLQNIAQFGLHLGLAFQIVDDILDVTSTPEQLGKATGKDAAKGKNTYPSLLGLEASRQQAREQFSAAMQCIAELGPAADGLRSLSRFVIEREV